MGKTVGKVAEPAPEGTIEQWRAEIDRLDAQLVALLNRRAECAVGIGHIKRRAGQPVYVPDRERAVIAKVAAANQGPLPDAAVESIFQTIMGQMRLLEERLAEHC
jgi:chorismate mutase-like protein